MLWLYRNTGFFFLSNVSYLRTMLYYQILLFLDLCTHPVSHLRCSNLFSFGQITFLVHALSWLLDRPLLSFQLIWSWLPCFNFRQTNGQISWYIVFVVDVWTIMEILNRILWRALIVIVKGIKGIKNKNKNYRFIFFMFKILSPS